jgi:hypothetical protein
MRPQSELSRISLRYYTTAQIPEMHMFDKALLIAREFQFSAISLQHDGCSEVNGGLP